MIAFLYTVQGTYPSHPADCPAVAYMVAMGIGLVVLLGIAGGGGRRE